MGARDIVLQTTKAFYSIYFLNKELHAYKWRGCVKTLEFTMNNRLPKFPAVRFDLSYVSSLKLGCGGPVDVKHLKYFKRMLGWIWDV